MDSKLVPDIKTVFLVYKLEYSLDKIETIWRTNKSIQNEYFSELLTAKILSECLKEKTLLNYFSIQDVYKKYTFLKKEMINDLKQGKKKTNIKEITKKYGRTEDSAYKLLYEVSKMMQNLK